MILALTVLSGLSLASEPPYVRVSQGAAWLQGPHVGSTDRATVQGLAVQQAVFIGGTSGRWAVGAQLGVQGAPWLGVLGPERYAARPNLTAGIGATVLLRVGDGGWHGILTAGARLPFQLVGREHRSLVETFMGGGAGAGVGYEGRSGPRGWAWGGEATLEGQRLGGVASRLPSAPGLRLWVPSVRITVAHGGWR